MPDSSERGQPAPTRARSSTKAKRRPGPPCPVCVHDARDEIDLALATGVEARAEVMRRYGLDRTAGYRHSHGGHLDDRLATHASEAASDAAASLLDRIVALADRLDRRLAARDNDTGSDQDVARLARELRGVLDLVARVSGRLVDRVEVSNVDNGYWSTREVVGIVDSILNSIETEWPEAAAAARSTVRDLTSATGGST